MRRIYVAGAFRSNSLEGCLRNIVRGISLSVKVLLAGFAPFVPWTDVLLYLVAPPEDRPKIRTNMLMDCSMSWLEAADAVLIVETGWQKSLGTRAEIARADELDIPVFFSLSALQQYFD